MNVGLSLLKCSVCCVLCSQIRVLLFLMRTDKKYTMRWLVQRWVPCWKVSLCTQWRWPVLFADCVFIYVTSGSCNTQWTKKHRKIWRRTSDWTEIVVSCIWEHVLWEHVLLVVKTCCYLMRYFGSTHFEYRAIHRLCRFRFSVSISISG